MPSWMKWAIALAIGFAIIATGFRVSWGGTWILRPFFILNCLVLIIVVLLQSGKAADLAGAFGGAGSQTAFGPRGAANVLSKATTWCAIMFMVCAFAMTLRTDKGVVESGSIRQRFSRPRRNRLRPRLRRFRSPIRMIRCRRGNNRLRSLRLRKLRRDSSLRSQLLRNLSLGRRQRHSRLRQLHNLLPRRRKSHKVVRGVSGTVQDSQDTMLHLFSKNPDGEATAANGELLSGCGLLVPRLEWFTSHCAVVAELADAPA